MRLLITILFFSLNASAETYYVSNAGSDAANGLTTSTPWQTISKVIETAVEGDSVLFKRGDVWPITSKINPPGQDIYFGSYGTGAMPLFTALETVTGFTNVGNIWTASVPNSVKSLNTVVINGVIRAKARTPNTGWNTITAYSGNNKIVVAGSNATNLIGTEYVSRTAHWVIDVVKVASQSGDTLILSPGLTYTPSLGGNGYFYQNRVADLDAEGEWYYDSTNKILKVFSTTMPTDVKISTVDTLIHISQKNNITFDGFSFAGANKVAVQIDTSRYPTIKNSSINYSGTIAISAQKSAYITIDNDSIQNSLSGGAFLRRVDPLTPMQDTCNYATITNNYFKNTGHFAGMGMSGNGRYMALNIVGNQSNISGNRFDSTGYVPLFFNGGNSLIEENHITNFCYVKDDGGGIYTVVGNYIPANYNDGSIVRRNEVSGGIGALAGTSSASFAAAIYLDNLTNDVYVYSNIMYNCYTAAAFLNEANSIPFYDNTILNDIGSCLTISGSNALVTNLNVKQNILYSQSASQFIINRRNGTSVATMDSNYYSRPLDEANSFSRSNVSYDLSGWKTATGQDANSLGLPSGINDATPLFYSNPTNDDVTISIAGSYLDSKGSVHINSVTLTPFTAIILYKTINEIIPPVSTLRIGGRFKLQTL